MSAQDTRRTPTTASLTPISGTTSLEPPASDHRAVVTLISSSWEQGSEILLLACSLSTTHKVICLAPSGREPKVVPSGMEVRRLLPEPRSVDLQASLIISTVPTTWRQLVAAACRAGHKDRLAYWDQGGKNLPPGYNCILLRSTSGPPIDGWRHHAVIAGGSGASYTKSVEEVVAGLQRKIKDQRIVPLPPAKTTDPLITVSMPTWNTPPEILRRAVLSVLAQTEKKIRLIVVNDGRPPQEVWGPLEEITDPRLVRFDLLENHGRYFADAVTLAACDTTWWGPHDADDWSEPTRLSKLLALSGGSDAVLGNQLVHGVSGRVELEVCRPWEGPHRKMRWYGHMAGLYRPEWLRKVGGPHPGFRVGYDTVLTGLAHLCGRVSILSEPLYHRCCREGSLTRAQATGIGSPFRRGEAEKLNQLWADLVDSGAGGAPEVIQSSISDELKREVLREAGRLRLQLGSTGDPLFGRQIWQQGWTLPRTTAAELESRLETLRPRVVLEAGSGVSTLVLARYAQRHSARVVTLEHDPKYLESTQQLLARFGLAEFVDLRLAPLDDRPWYLPDPPDGIEFALIDGPPLATGGRAAALPALINHFAPNWELWMDDASRESERSAALGWSRGHGVFLEYSPIGHGLLVVRNHKVVRAQIDASDTVITLLTGRRPRHLEDTFNSIHKRAPGLLASAQVYVLHQGKDPESSDLLWRRVELIDYMEERGEIWPIGQAISHLAGLAQSSGRKFWLHLEDDWRLVTTKEGWLDEARNILETLPRIGQVRMRHFGEPVLARHMVTQQPIVWSSHEGHLESRAHWTFNPTLMRVDDIPKIYPVDGELQSMQKAVTTNMDLVAHLYPGVWVHTGDDASLRVRTRCKL